MMAAVSSRLRTPGAPAGGAILVHRNQGGEKFFAIDQRPSVHGDGRPVALNLSKLRERRHPRMADNDLGVAFIGKFSNRNRRDRGGCLVFAQRAPGQDHVRQVVGCLVSRRVLAHAERRRAVASGKAERGKTGEPGAAA